MLCSLCQTESISIALVGCGTLSFEENGQDFEDCRFAIVIAAEDTGHDFTNRNDGSDSAASEMGECGVLEAHGDFLVRVDPKKPYDLVKKNYHSVLPESAPSLHVHLGSYKRLPQIRAADFQEDR